MMCKMDGSERKAAMGMVLGCRVQQSSKSFWDYDDTSPEVSRPILRESGR